MLRQSWAGHESRNLDPSLSLGMTRPEGVTLQQPAPANSNRRCSKAVSLLPRAMRSPFPATGRIRRHHAAASA